MKGITLPVCSPCQARAVSPCVSHKWQAIQLSFVDSLTIPAMPSRSSGGLHGRGLRLKAYHPSRHRAAALLLDPDDSSRRRPKFDQVAGHMSPKCPFGHLSDHRNRADFHSYAQSRTKISPAVRPSYRGPSADVLALNSRRTRY